MTQMTIKHTGQLVGRFRKEKGVSAKILCSGLCTPSILSDYEKGIELLEGILKNARRSKLDLEYISNKDQ